MKRWHVRPDHPNMKGGLIRNTQSCIYSIGKRTSIASSSPKVEWRHLNECTYSTFETLSQIVLFSLNH